MEAPTWSAIGRVWYAQMCCMGNICTKAGEQLRCRWKPRSNSSEPDWSAWAKSHELFAKELINYLLEKECT